MKPIVYSLLPLIVVSMVAAEEGTPQTAQAKTSVDYVLTDHFTGEVIASEKLRILPGEHEREELLEAVPLKGGFRIEVRSRSFEGKDGDGFALVLQRAKPRSVFSWNWFQLDGVAEKLIGPGKAKVETTSNNGQTKITSLKVIETITLTAADRSAAERNRQPADGPRYRWTCKVPAGSVLGFDAETAEEPQGKTIVECDVRHQYHSASD